MFYRWTVAIENKGIETLVSQMYVAWENWGSEDRTLCAVFGVEVVPLHL